MGVVLEKFGLSLREFMHGTNFINIDMMLIDNPRILTDKEKEKTKKVIIDDGEQMERELNKMFDF